MADSFFPCLTILFIVNVIRCFEVQVEQKPKCNTKYGHDEQQNRDDAHQNPLNCSIIPEFQSAHFLHLTLILPIISFCFKRKFDIEYEKEMAPIMGPF